MKSALLPALGLAAAFALSPVLGVSVADAAPAAKHVVHHSKKKVVHHSAKKTTHHAKKKVHHPKLVHHTKHVHGVPAKKS